jgi:hypothetical protein
MFDLAPKAKIGTVGFLSFSEAYAAASTSVPTIVQLIEDVLTFDSGEKINKDLVVKGGYNADFSTQSGFTAIQGGLTIGSGSLVVDRVILR